MVGATAAIRTPAEARPADPEVTVLTAAGSDVRPFLSPVWVVRHLFGLRDSILRLTRQEMARLYAGTALGLFLAVIQGLVLMGTYVFVFSYVFEARWSYPGMEPGSGRFGLVLFAGLLTFNLFADSVARAPNLIHDNAKLVTKVVFPVEILPIALLMRVGLVALINLGLLVPAVALVEGRLPVTLLLGVVLLASFALLALGVTYVVAAVGTFFRDAAHAVGVLLRVLMFATPVFYSVEGLGPRLQSLLLLNPLTWAVESSRMLFAIGQTPPLWYVGALLLVGPLSAYLGLLFFMRLRKGFRDVL